MDAPLESDPQRDEVSSDSSESSSSSSDSSSREASPPKLMPDLSADEVTGALHRSMWHVALTSMGDNGDVIRTACGRRFPRASITILSDLQLERGQNLYMLSLGLSQRMEGSRCLMRPILGWLQTQSWRLESKNTCAHSAVAISEGYHV